MDEPQLRGSGGMASAHQLALGHAATAVLCQPCCAALCTGRGTAQGTTCAPTPPLVLSLPLACRCVQDRTAVGLPLGPCGGGARVAGGEA